MVPYHGTLSLWDLYFSRERERYVVCMYVESVLSGRYVQYGMVWYHRYFVHIIILGFNRGLRNRH